MSLSVGSNRTTRSQSTTMSLSVGSSPTFTFVNVYIDPLHDPANHPPEILEDNPSSSSIPENFLMRIIVNEQIQPDSAWDDGTDPEDDRFSCRSRSPAELVSSALHDYLSFGCKKFRARKPRDRWTPSFYRRVSDILTKVYMDFLMDRHVDWDESGDVDEEASHDLIHRLLEETLPKIAQQNHRSISVTMERIISLPDDEYRALLPAQEVVADFKHTVKRLIAQEVEGKTVVLGEWDSLYDDLKAATIPSIFWNGILDLVSFSGLSESRKECLRTDLLAALWDMAEIVIERESAGQHVPRPKPAAATAVEDLPKDVVTATDDSRVCVICMEQLTIGSEFTSMPCSHEYHSSCIERWLLESSNVCPLCRHELPTAE